MDLRSLVSKSTRIQLEGKGKTPLLTNLQPSRPWFTQPKPYVLSPKTPLREDPTSSISDFVRFLFWGLAMKGVLGSEYRVEV